MIKVNLLPQELMGKSGGSKSSSPSEGGFEVIAAILLFVLLVGGIGGFSLYSINEAEGRKKKAESEKKKLEGELRDLRARYEEVEMAISVLKNQKAVLDALDPADRLLWSKKLNMLPLLVPENVFLTDIVVTEKVDEVETEDSIKANQAWIAAGSKGTPPPKQKVPVINQKMDLTGLAYSPEGRSEDRLRRITQFRTNIESEDVKIPYTGKNEEFITGFRRAIGISAIELTSVQDRDVSKFTFSLQATPVKINLPSTEVKKGAKPAAPPAKK